MSERADETVATLCDDADVLLAATPPRYEGARAVLARARTRLAESDVVSDRETLTSRLDALEARAILTAEHASPEPAWKGWMIPGAFALVALWVVSAAWRHDATNYARKATVAVSSQTEDLDPAALVDGNVRAQAVRTEREDRPWAVLDLGRPRDIEKIDVFMGQKKRPLAVEISLDGAVYGQYGARSGASKRWEIEKDARARYVRVVRTKHGSLQLNEVRVFSP